MAASPKKTIRFEDLGEPVQRLLKRVKGGVTEEDMALFEYVSVKDMAKIFSEMSSDRHAEEIWEELKNALIARREKAERKRRELEQRQTELDAEAAGEEAARRTEEEAARRSALEAEERQRARAERKKRQAEETAAAEEQARLDAEADAERLAQEDEDRKREEKRRRREAKRRALEEEQERLREEQEREAKKKSKNSKKEWDDYVKAHPLEFSNNQEQEIQQVHVDRETKPPPKADADLLNRTYTPKCPNCQARFSKPPKEWDCPMCFRRYRQKIKTWQPDADTDKCAVCQAGVGRFSRHHCRNCGRVVCGNCSQGKASIPAYGFDEPVKVCSQCVTAVATSSPEKTGAPETNGTAAPAKA